MNRLSVLIVFLTAVVTVSAQSVGDNNRIIITTGFTPSIKDARKINEQPHFADTIYTPPKFNYSIINTRVSTPFSVRPIGAAKMSGEKLDKVYKSYVMAGMGNYATPVFEFLYSMGRSRDQRGGVQIKHMSSAGKIDDYIYPGFSDNLARGYYTKLWKKNRFNADVSYLRNVRHYYGVNVLEDTLLIKNGDITDEANKQVFNTADISLGFTRYKTKRKEAFYDYKLRYYYLIDYYGSRENGVNYNGINDWNVDFVNSFKKQRIGFTSKVDFFNNSDSLHIANSYIIGLKPFYRFEFNKLSAQVGLNTNIYKDSVSEIGFFPELKLRLDVIDDVLNFVLDFYGGARKTNFKELTTENPFVNSIVPLQMSVNKFSTYFGMQSSISRFINLELGMRYEKWENAPFFITDTTVTLHNKFTVVYDDYDMVEISAGVSYHLNKKWNVAAKGNYYVYNTMNLLSAWHKPAYDLKLIGDYNLADKILVHARLIYNGPTDAPEYVENGTAPGKIITTTEIKGWFDASLGFEYRYRKRLGIFLNLNNIAATRYYRWYNYPSYGFNVIGGVSYIF